MTEALEANRLRIQELDEQAAALEAQRAELQHEYDRLEEEVEIRTALKRSLCESSESEDEGLGDLTQLTELPTSPLGSISEESFLSEAQPSETEHPLNDTAIPQTPQLTSQLDWNRFSPLDIFSDPRIVPPPATSAAPEAVRAPVRDALFHCPVSEVHEGVMELLRMRSAERKFQNEAVSQSYLKSKSVPAQMQESSAGECRFPISEYEEWKRIVGLWGEELLFEMWHQIPDQANDPYVRTFIDKSRLVQDPEAEMRQSFESRPWSNEEQQIFLERFMEHPKDFYEIAKGLPHRSTGDCVQFFYANKKSELFGAVRRKQQLKKRRLQSESNREEGSLHMASRKRHLRATNMTEEEKSMELQLWILKRLDLKQLPFTEDQLTSAVQKFGFNYKALAKEVGCQKPSVVGAYLLCHCKRFGLEEYFSHPSRSVLHSAVSLYERLPNEDCLPRAISAPDRLTEERNGFRETRAGTRYSHPLNNTLTEEIAEDRQKRRRHNPKLETLLESPWGVQTPANQVRHPASC